MTSEAKRLIKEGKLWPYQYYSHGAQCRYTLSESTIVNDGWILLTDEYAKSFDTVEGRRKMAVQDLEAYTDWANGEVYGYMLTDPYGKEVEGGSIWGIYGYDYAVEAAKRAVDADIKHDKPARHAKRAQELHK